MIIGGTYALSAILTALLRMQRKNYMLLMKHEIRYIHSKCNFLKSLKILITLNLLKPHAAHLESLDTNINKKF